MLHRLSKHRAWSLLLKVLIGYVLCAHSLKTLARNRDWHSASSLHKAGVRFNPSNPILLSNLGLEHALKEDYSQAELLYLSSMEQTPRFSGGYHNYGLLMKLLHRYEEAEEVSLTKQIWSIFDLMCCSQLQRPLQAYEFTYLMVLGIPANQAKRPRNNSYFILL